MDSDAELWNELCEDAECDDTNYHATVDELMQRIQDVTANINAMESVERIIEDEYTKYIKERNSQP